MDDKGGNGYGGSGSYQQKKWDDNQNQKDQKAAKDSGLPDNVDHNGLTYTNGAWCCYQRKCGFNKTHTSGLNLAWKKEV